MSSPTLTAGLAALSLLLAAPALAQEPQGVSAAAAAAEAALAPAVPELPFAPEIARFAALDAAAPPKSCAFLFVGSSTIRFWRTLDQDMAPYPVINRGFGGSRIADVGFYFDRVVAPYRPRAIFFYAGENDLAAGQTVEEVVGDFERFMEMKTAALGDVPVHFISLKPSRLRLAQMPLQAEVNARIRALADARPDLDYVDVLPAMLDQGQPKDIFVADGLHMRPEGYALWTGVVRPVVEQEARSGRGCSSQTMATAP